MKVYVSLKAGNCKNVLWLDNDRRCRLFSVHSTISEMGGLFTLLSTVCTIYKNNLCRKTVI